MTGIQWTDTTWNPVRGCSRVSAGCDNCYAMGQAHRFAGPGQPYEGLTTIRRGRVDWAGMARLIPEKLSEPLRWRKPRRVFVNSMSDLFHESLSNEEVAAVFGVMAACPQHTFQVLTKRPERMREWFAHKDDAGDGVDAKVYQVAVEEHGYVDREQAMVCALPPDTSLPPYFRWPLPNVMLGVSAECQKTADERIPLLLETPAAVRFVSAEPLLEGVDISSWLGDFYSTWAGGFGHGLDWCIVGGESGPGVRPCALEWIEAIVDQCKTASVPVFVKRLGSCVVSESRACETDEEAKREFGFKSRWLWQAGLRDRKGGDPSEWPEHLRVREFPVMGDEAGAKLNGSGQ